MMKKCSSCLRSLSISSYRLPHKEISLKAHTCLSCYKVACSALDTDYVPNYERGCVICELRVPKKGHTCQLCLEQLDNGTHIDEIIGNNSLTTETDQLYYK